MGALNLGPVARQIERDFLDDVIEAYPRDADTTTGVLNPDTLQIEVPAPDMLWTGPASLLTSGRSEVAALAALAGPDATNADGVLLVPLAAPARAVDDVIVVVGSRLPGGPRDPQIVGTRWRVSELPEVATFAVVRRIYLERLAPAATLAP